MLLIPAVNVLGDAIHNYIDGLLIGASWLVSPTLGISTTIAVLLHEISLLPPVASMFGSSPSTAVPLPRPSARGCTARRVRPAAIASSEASDVYFSQIADLIAVTDGGVPCRSIVAPGSCSR